MRRLSRRFTCAKETSMSALERQPATRAPARPFYRPLRAFAAVCLIGALATDIAYGLTADFPWVDFSDWLVSAGAVVGMLRLHRRLDRVCRAQARRVRDSVRCCSISSPGSSPCSTCCSTPATPGPRSCPGASALSAVAVLILARFRACHARGACAGDQRKGRLMRHDLLARASLARRCVPPRGGIERARRSIRRSRSAPIPMLPAPQQYLLPPMHLAKVVGWKDGETPTVAPGLKIEAFATGLQHPRSLYVLPNGDVLVVESQGPQRAADPPAQGLS